jgi:hypothetical protein
MDVLLLDNSLVKGINSGAPGIYFLSGSGIFRPCSKRGFVRFMGLKVGQARWAPYLRGLIILHNTT